MPLLHGSRAPLLARGCSRDEGQADRGEGRDRDRVPVERHPGDRREDRAVPQPVEQIVEHPVGRAAGAVVGAVAPTRSSAPEAPAAHAARRGSRATIGHPAATDNAPPASRTERVIAVPGGCRSNLSKPASQVGRA